jgi:hypothetical protein
MGKYLLYVEKIEAQGKLGTKFKVEEKSIFWVRKCLFLFDEELSQNEKKVEEQPTLWIDVIN